MHFPCPSSYCQSELLEDSLFSTPCFLILQTLTRQQAVPETVTVLSVGLQAVNKFFYYLNKIGQLRRKKASSVGDCYQPRHCVPGKSLRPNSTVLPANAKYPREDTYFGVRRMFPQGLKELPLEDYLIHTWEEERTVFNMTCTVYHSLLP